LALALNQQEQQPWPRNVEGGAGDGWGSGSHGSGVCP